MTGQLACYLNRTFWRATNINLILELGFACINASLGWDLETQLKNTFKTWIRAAVYPGERWG